MVEKEKYVCEYNIKKWVKALSPYMNRLDFIPDNCALLVIDMQNYFTDKDSYAFIPSSPQIMPNVINLVKEFKERGLPIIFTKHIDSKVGMMIKWWNKPIVKGSKDSEVCDELKDYVEKCEVITKSKYSAFQKTDLEEYLRKNNITSVVITGIMTHLCCESTAREAFMKDFKVFFAIDATATTNQELHLASLKTLSHGFVVPMTTNEILEILR